jgi:hypothetical protein
MILTALIARLQQSLDRRRRYLRLVAEIESLTPRDLADMRGDRAEMLATARRQIYG